MRVFAKSFSTGSTSKHMFCRWAAVPDDDWPEDEAQRGVILADFATNTRYGDR